MRHESASACESGHSAAARCAVVCCATNGFGRQPHAAAAVQTRHPDCSIVIAAGYGPITAASVVADDVDALVREITPGAFSVGGSSITGSSQALIAGDCTLGACGVLLATVTVGFSSSEQQLLCLQNVLAAAAAAGGAPV